MAFVEDQLNRLCRSLLFPNEPSEVMKEEVSAEQTRVDCLSSSDHAQCAASPSSALFILLTLSSSFQAQQHNAHTTLFIGASSCYTFCVCAIGHTNPNNPLPDTLCW